MPNGAERPPVVLLIHGSGQSDKNETEKPNRTGCILQNLILYCHIFRHQIGVLEIALVIAQCCNTPFRKQVLALVDGVRRGEEIPGDVLSGALFGVCGNYGYWK